METLELHHKMSKKIAQLTKVIFHINTKNDENSAITEAIRQSYEDEVDRIMHEANRKLKVAYETIKTLKDERLKKKELEELRTVYECEKKDSIEVFQQFKTQCQDLECNLNKTWADKMTDQGRELIDAKNKIIITMEQLEELKLLLNQHVKALESQREEYEGQIRAAHEKYSQIATHKENELAERIKKDNILFDEYKRKVESLMSDLACQEETLRVDKLNADNTISALNQSIKLLEDSLDIEKSNLNSKCLENSQLNGSISDLEKKLKVASEVGDKTSKQIDSLEMSLKEWKDKFYLENKSRLQVVESNDTLKTQQTDTQNEFKLVKDKLSVCETDLLHANEEISQLKIKLSDAERKLDFEKQKSQTDVSKRENNWNTTKIRLEEELGRALDETDVLRKASSSLQSGLDSKNAEMCKLRDEFNIASDLWAKEKVNFESSVADLTSQLRARAVASSEDMKQLQSSLQEIQEEKESWKQTHQLILTQVEDLTTKQQLLLNENTKLNKMNSDLENISSELKQKINDPSVVVSSEAYRTLEGETAILKSQISSVVSEKEDILRNLESVSAQLQASSSQLFTLRQKEFELLEKLSTSESNCSLIESKYISKIEELKSAVQISEGEARRIRESGEDAKLQKEQELLDKLRFVESTLEMEKRSSEMKVSEIRQSMVSQHASELNEWKTKYSDLQKSASATTIEMEQAIANARQSANKETELVRKEGEYKLETIIQNHQKEKVELREVLLKDHNLQLDNIRTKLATEHDEAVSSIKLLHANEVSEIKTGFSIQLADKDRELVLKLEQQESQFILERRHMESRISSIVNELADVRTQLVRSEQYGKEKSQQISELDSKIREVQSKLDEANRNSIEMEQKHLNERKVMFDNHEESIRNLSSQYSQQINQIKEEHEIATARLERAFVSERAALEEKSTIFKAKISELQKAYDNRPSRDDDVSKIRAYEEDLRQKEAWLMEAKDAIQQQRLELLNRDANYTRMMFNGGNGTKGGPVAIPSGLGGSQPVLVGVLNPIEKAKERQAIARQKR